MSSKSKVQRHIRSEESFDVVVRFLEDDTSDEIQVPEDATGKWLFDEICRRQDVIEEREYFGLRYLEHEILSSPTKQWLDLTRGALAQLKHTNPRVVSFRFKHYPAEPMTDLKLPKTHYLLYRQLRRDLVSGRLVAPAEEMVRLAALVVQVELGDNSAQDQPQLSTKSDVELSYIATFQVLHNQTQRMEGLVLEEHKKLEGLLPSEAASDMIQLASSLETYGVDPVRVKTKAYGSRPIHLGLTHRGVAEFVSNRCQKLHLWPNITWMTCDGKHFILATTKRTSNKKKQTVETVNYKCETKAVARAMWEWASDRKLFLTLESSSSVKPVKSKRSLFSRTHTFRFSGRCRREVLGRPTLAATLPSDLSICQTEPTTSYGIHHASAPGAHSISMVALANETFMPPESVMQPIGELEITEDVQIAQPLNCTVSPCTTQSDSQMPNTNSTYPSNLSGLESAFSEPVGQFSPNSICPDGPVNDPRTSTRHGTGEPYILQRKVLPDQLVSLFHDLPRRRYAPGAKMRQIKLEQIRQRHSSGENRNRDIFDSEVDDDLSTDAAIAELREAAEVGKAWAAEQANTISPQVNSRDANPSSKCSIWSRMFTSSNGTNHAQLSSKIDSDQPATSVSTSSRLSETTETVSDSETTDQSVSVWRTFAFTTGLFTGASLLACTLLLETEIHSPITTAIREHPWILEFDARYYRPIRSALFGFWRRQ